MVIIHVDSLQGYAKFVNLDSLIGLDSVVGCYVQLPMVYAVLVQLVIIITMDFV
jgi:hypothetical protein